MKLYVEVKEKEGSGDRSFDSFIYENKEYILTDCTAGGVSFIDGKACINFVCRIGRKRFLVYCEDEYPNKRYFVLKNEKARD